MSKIVPVSTDKAPTAVGPYSQAISMDPLVFVSGQLGIDPGGSGLREGFEAQARQAMDNLMAILAEADSGPGSVLAVDVFLTDMARFQEFNIIYSEYFTDHKPARAAIEVGGLPLGGLVEVKCMAKKNG